MDSPWAIKRRPKLEERGEEEKRREKEKREKEKQNIINKEKRKLEEDANVSKKRPRNECKVSEENKDAGQKAENNVETNKKTKKKKKSKTEKNVQNGSNGAEQPSAASQHQDPKLPNEVSERKPDMAPEGVAEGVATGERFEDLDLPKPLSERTMEAIRALGFNRMTPVQQATIPLLLTNKDVAVQACTGSGKTAAFLIPAFEILLRLEERLKIHDVGAMVIAPTRELAMQILSVARVMSSKIPEVSVAMLTGGSDNDESLRVFMEEGGNIVIGTPGRLQHTLTKVTQFNVKKLELLILDEADRLLDMGFQAALNSILEKLPKLRRTGLFSATMNNEVAALARAGLRNPRQITVTVHGKANKQQSTPVTLSNLYTVCPESAKLDELVKFLQTHKLNKIMIFFLTCAHVDYFGRLLPLLPQLEGLKIEGLHGKMVQKRRSKTVEAFASNRQSVLLCTDVSARGLDFPDVDWIVQYDAPQDPSFFIHRVGRTARFGKQGSSILFLTPAEDSYVGFLKLRKVPLSFSPPQSKPEEADELKKQVRLLVKKDLDLHEKGQRAFVSIIRAYKEHHCNYIFQLSNLSFGGLATSMGLLVLPKMPELKGIPIRNFETDDSDVTSLRYADKTREKARKARMLKELANEEKTKKDKEMMVLQRIKNRAWSQKTTAKVFKKERKMKKGKSAGEAQEELEDFAKEARLLRKLRKGAISKDQFDKEMGGGSDSD